MDQDVITVPLKVPCYLVRGRDGFVMIDTGDASDRAHLEYELGQLLITPENLKLILLTHGDFDHAGNAAFLQKEYGAKIAMHADDAGMVEGGNQNWNRKGKSDRITLFGRIIISISGLFARSVQFTTFKPDVLVEDGQDLSAFGFDAKVLRLPGHSKGSIGILTAHNDLFSGDLLMNMLKPDLHFMIDDMVDLKTSVEKLKGLNVRTVYPGHGKPFPMAQFVKNQR